MSKTTVSASATGLPDSPCRVAQLAQDARAIIDAYSRADVEIVASGGKEKNTALDIQMRVLAEKRDGIERAAAVFPAASATGAMFQLSLIKDLTDLIDSWVPENSKHKQECDEARKAINRMCYSVRDFIVARTGANPEDGCGDYFMSEKYNPHRLIAAAIAEEDAARE